MTRLIAEILSAHKAGIALWCGATTSGPQRPERARDPAWVAGSSAPSSAASPLSTLRRRG